MNTIEQILKKELKLSDDMCSRFLELVETKHLKKKELLGPDGTGRRRPGYDVWLCYQ